MLHKYMNIYVVFYIFNELDKYKCGYAHHMGCWMGWGGTRLSKSLDSSR